MNIRLATLSDVDALAPLLAQLGYPTNAEQVRSRFEPLLNDSLHYSAVAEANGFVVGFVGARVDRGYEYDGLQTRILALVVDENHRGGGVGSALVADVERWSRQCGAHKMMVNTSHRRTQTHDFYRRVGFESTGLRFVKQL